MQLLLTSTAQDCIDALHERLSTELAQGKKVLWFVTGGSNIAVDTVVMNRLDPNVTANLNIILTDERYGDYGHANSNWQQLLDSRIEFAQANALSVLQQDNQSLQQTTAIYDTTVARLLDEADVVIGFYGLGTDGHIAGILPGSSAVHDTSFAASYIGDDFPRITTTFTTIRRCDVAFMCAMGTSKRQALENLRTEISLSEQPAQVLKQLSEVYIYNDQIGDQI